MRDFLSSFFCSFRVFSDGTGAEFIFNGWFCTEWSKLLICYRADGPAAGPLRAWSPTIYS